MIYLVSGKKTSGKDTVANYISKKTLYPIYCFAQPIKEAISEIFGVSSYYFNQENKEKKLIRIHKPSNRSSFDEHQIDLEKYTSFSVRSIMQDMGQYFRNNYDKNIWINLLIQKIKKDKVNNFIISDVRYKNEIEKIKETFKDVITIRINRPNTKHNKYSNHISETDLDEHLFDYTLNNTGTLEDLAVQVNSILLK